MKKSLFAALLVLPILAWATESLFDGDWKIDQPNHTSVTFALESSSNGMTYSAGPHGSWQAKFDGKDYPINPGIGGIYGMTISLTKLNDRSYRETIKSPRGEVRSVLTRTVSPDGKTLTLKTTISWKRENLEDSRTITQVATKQ
jgi:hypothetical protein